MPNASPRKPKAKAKAKSGNADAEKKAKAVLSTWKLQSNRLKRVETAMKDHIDEWKWAQDDLNRYKVLEKDLNKYIHDKGLTDFVADFQAAIFSPQAMKSFKNQRKETFADDLTLLVEGSVPVVNSMDDVVEQIENTAFARKCTGYTPEKGSGHRR